MRLYARPSTMEDVERLAVTLRDEDVEEIRASSGSTPLEALTVGYENSSYCMTIVGDDETPVGIFGVAPSTSYPDVGYVWMLATPLLAAGSMTFLRNSRDYVRKMNSQFQLLVNAVDSRNTVHIKWLMWCGFKFIKRHDDLSREGVPFYEFVRLREE